MRWKILLAGFFVAACAAGAGEAQAPTAPVAEPVVTTLASDPAVTRDAAEMPSGEYTLDPRHTSVTWRIRHWGLAPYTGRFDAESGALNFDAADPARSTVSVRIPLASISTGLLNQAGERAFDRDISAYLGAEAHPDIVFTSTSIEATSATTGRIHGELSFNGRTHPVTLEAVFEGGRVIPTSQRPTLGFTARGIIQRSRWLEGVPPLHNSASPGDEVELIISAEFTRPPAQQAQ